MQERNVTQLAELEELYQRLAAVEAAREHYADSRSAITAELESLEARRKRRHAIVMAISTLLVALFTTGVYHAAQSSIVPSSITSSDINAAFIDSALESQAVLRSDSTTAETRTPVRYRRNNPVTTRQWGPLLVMPGQGTQAAAGFDPVVKQQQADLLVLGFDVGETDGYKGELTRRVIAEFRALYLADSGASVKDNELAIKMATYAALARKDSARYGIDTGTAAAIRLGSVRTGVDFAYLMKLAATESNFDPQGKAPTSSASGLYQFTRDTWLNVIKQHGKDYGLLAEYADKIDYKVYRSGYRRPIVSDEASYQHLLALRKNPRLSAIMAAESVLDHRQHLTEELGREPSDTDLYFSHFLGLENATTFLRSREETPHTHAKTLFPEAAESNRDIFHRETNEPRTVNEVYALFEDKYNTRRFD